MELREVPDRTRRPGGPALSTHHGPEQSHNRLGDRGAPVTRDADVGIVGLGSTGSMAAWRLARAGLSVHGFEQFGIAHDRGAAGGESRRFATHAMGDPRDVPLAV